MDKALDLGAQYLATGHYSRIQNQQLLKARDRNKDQSYFLYTLRKNILDKRLFPLGDLEKPQVRALARQYNLATSEKKDSTGICFILVSETFALFLAPNGSYRPGNFEDLNGKIIGQHMGVAYYTLGQRKGLWYRRT